MPPFRYRLIDSNGSDLGPFVSSTDWQAGGLIETTDGYLRITAVVEPETEENFNAYLVVEPFKLPEASGPQ
jgi:hypothetical protein